jgi:hypothetical protein
MPWIHHQDVLGPDSQVLKNKRNCEHKIMDGKDKDRWEIKEKSSACCQKPGHMIRDCRQPPQQRQWQPRQSTSQGRQAETDEYKQIACVVADNRNPQQEADDWLKNIANEDDETKDAIMQTLWKQEDFPNA